MRNRLFIIWTVVAAALAAALFAFAMPSAGRSGEAATEPDAETPDISPPEEPPDPSKLTYGVDPSLTPSMPEVEHLEGDDRPRPTARLRSTGGTESDLVLDELLVTFANDAELQAFVERWNGEVLQRDVDEDEGVVDALVRIDPTTAELDQLAVDLLAVEPHHKGELRASDERVFSLMAIAASESAHHGTEVAMNWVAEPFSIQDGVSSEAPDQEPNAFNWSWISSRQPQDSGIDAALQLLHGRGSVANRVKIMIVDHGFFYNADFPLEATMPTGEWRRENSQNCSNNSECPFHGTDVTMAAMGRPDNGFGTLGPAGTIGDLIALDGYDDMWGRFRDIKKVAKDERPGVINMSYGHIVTTFQDATERKADRWFRKIRDKYGALSFAAAGNDGIDVDSNDALAMPCEIDSVICVGGVQSSPLSRSPGSNFGTKTGSSTVEIYGPMCTVGLKNPDVPGDGATKRVCGTSVASPVVAGVAALVMAANPTLGPKDVWRILQDTAHRESLGPEVTGHNLRVDAHRAVSEAMNIPYTIPTVQIVSPANGTEFRQDEFFELSATAENFAGLDLPIQWRRANGGNVNDVPTLEPVIVGELEPGRHVFQAWAVDVLGVPGMATVEVVVENNPPQLSITSP
ncbi:MAG TPA: S8/S53 family peptidase, partial [Ilumatobacteraceae bacterium]